MWKGEQISWNIFKILQPRSLSSRMRLLTCDRLMDTENVSFKYRPSQRAGWIHVKHSLWHTLDKPEVSNGSSHSWVTFSFGVHFAGESFTPAWGLNKETYTSGWKTLWLWRCRCANGSVDSICDCSGLWGKLNYDSNKFISNFHFQIPDPLPPQSFSPCITRWKKTHLSRK